MVAPVGESGRFESVPGYFGQNLSTAKVWPENGREVKVTFEVRGRDIFDESFGAGLSGDPLLFHVASSAKNAHHVIATQWHIMNEMLQKAEHPTIDFSTFLSAVEEMADCESNGGTHADLAAGFDQLHWVPKK